MTTDCVRMVSQGEFISGGTEGLQVRGRREGGKGRRGGRMKDEEGSLEGGRGCR